MLLTVGNKAAARATPRAHDDFEFSLPRQVRCKLVARPRQAWRLDVPVVYGIGKKCVSETVAQVRRTVVSAMNELAVAARGFSLADDMDGLLSEVETGGNITNGGFERKVRENTQGARCRQVRERGNDLPRRLDGRSRRSGTERARHPFRLALDDHAVPVFGYLC